MKYFRKDRDKHHGFSILQKHAFFNFRNQNYNSIVQKNAFLKNREGVWQSIIVKNGVL